MCHRLLRLATRDVVLAGALGLASGFGAVQLLAQAAHERETGMVRWGPAVVWFRAGDSGAVLIYASAGYRSAFARPVVLTPADAERFAAMLESLSLAESPSGASGSTPASATGAAPTPARLADTMPSTFGDGNVVVEPPAASVSPRLQVRIGAAGPNAVTAVIFPDAAPAGALALREAARLATPVRVVPAPGAPPASIASNASAAPSSPTSPTPRAPAASAPPVLAASPASPAPSARPAFSAPPAALATSTSAAAPTRIVSAPLAETSTVAPALTRVSARLPRRRPARVIAAPLAHPVRATPLVAAPAPPPSPVRRTAAPSSGAIVAPARPAGLGGEPPSVGLDDETVGNLVRQWQPELIYCYTEFGLRQHPTLTGHLVVRIALSPDGSVGHSVIVRREWSGDGAAGAEACIQSRAAAWRFPPAAAGSVHEFALVFSH